MAKRGLGIDLNQRACLALMGLSENPEADIARLLRSLQSIEPLTRALLANALEGKSNSVTIRLTRAPKFQSLQKFQKRLNRLKHGRDAIHEIDALGYDKAVEAFASKLNVSPKSVIASIAMVRKIDAWILAIRNDWPDLSHIENRDLEMAYLYADAFGHDPVSVIKYSLPILRKLVDHWQNQLAGKAELGWGPFEP